MRKIVVLGAASEIAMQTQRCFVEDGASYYLVDLDQEKLDAIAGDLKTRGATQVETAALDLSDPKKHKKLVNEVVKAMGTIDVVFLAYGTLPNQEEMQADTDAALKSIQINFNSAFSLLERFATVLEEQGNGTIAAISSVAGDRVRKSNYIYGSAKAAMTGHLSGLRGRLAEKGIKVITIKPGQVDTPMTASFDKGGPLWATSEAVGRGIYRAIVKGRDVVYIPWFWRWIMFIIRHLPEFIFKRLKI